MPLDCQHGFRRLMATGTAVAALSAAVPTLADDQLPQTDGAWVTLGGEVVERNSMSFQLDHDDGIVTVTMDDWDAFDEAKMINPGESVTVQGRIDDSFYEQRTIEASSVYVAERHAKYFANPEDEDGDRVWSINDIDPLLVAEGTWIGIGGTVTD